MKLICDICGDKLATREIFWTKDNRHLMWVCKQCAIKCGDKEVPVETGRS